MIIIFIACSTIFTNLDNFCLHFSPIYSRFVVMPTPAEARAEFLLQHFKDGFTKITGWVANSSAKYGQVKIETQNELNKLWAEDTERKRLLKSTGEVRDRGLIEDDTRLMVIKKLLYANSVASSFHV